ncbi:MAG: hypothetical protein JXQ73_13585 [Phycisphaerae bacterium]|nr:hypothetical protein [Phycisphaerae bacterium]
MFERRSMILPSVLLAASCGAGQGAETSDRFEGTYYRGRGDVEYLRLLDVARRMFEPDPEFQNLPMLYTPAWNGLVEGPTWGAWWIQNSYGPTYCALPFYVEPYTTFLQNSHDLWFDQMGDGKHVGAKDWVAPDGSLCDAASPDWIIYKQGDGRTDIHDWGMEFTAAGLLMQAELLLISRDAKAIAHYLPKLERCADFIESRRDPNNNLFLTGPAGNLLAPSYAGWKRPDGKYDKAYLAGLSITTIAALDRLIELEKLAGRTEAASRYAERRDLACQGLPKLTTDEGYFLKYLDPDGTRHGVYGAEKHGYFEAVCNHDAICFRVVDDAQAERIYAKIAAIPGLRRHDLIITNDPALDDMYHPQTGIWKSGHWVNGGHWTTCEARMMMGYSRLGKFEDARRSMKRILAFARDFRMDNPLVDFGAAVYQPNQPINLCYDTLGAPAALIRGLFEYLYRADGLTILPHIPPGVSELHQRFPIRFGSKRLLLSTIGQGPVTEVRVNGAPWKRFDAKSVFLPYEETPDNARIRIALGASKLDDLARDGIAKPSGSRPAADEAFWQSDWLAQSLGPKPLPLRIGADSNGANRFLGEIAQARILARALTPAELAASARNAAPGLDKDPALVGEWIRPDFQTAGLSARIVGTAELVDAGLPGQRQGKAVRLTGQGFVEIPHDPKLLPDGAYTLDAWIRPGKLPDGGGRVIDKCTAGTSDNYMLDTHPGNSLRLITPIGVVAYAANLPVGQWSHVAATVEPKGQLRLYLNGKQVASAPADSTKGSGSIAHLRTTSLRFRDFQEKMAAADLGCSYEAAHARLATDYVDALQARWKLCRQRKITPLPGDRQRAADKSYVDTAVKLCDGLDKVLASYADSGDSRRKAVWSLWRQGKQ